MAEKDCVVFAQELPITFQVKYLGKHSAGGLWGIKYTRRPVDAMVAAVKNRPPGEILPIVKVKISTDGVQLDSVVPPSSQMPKDYPVFKAFYSIESISYGVQDLVYTRVFSMIVVKDAAAAQGQTPFDCHAFVCESRNSAKRITYALAAAFQEYSRRVKETQAENGSEIDGETASRPARPKRFAIDLRSPEEIEADMNEDETEA